MDIGTKLREARERKGITLSQMSKLTKISGYLLSRIERNDMARLPGGIFRRAYLRAFAREVGLNPDEIVREYRIEYEIGLNDEPLKVPVGGGDVSALWSQSRIWAAAATSLALLVYILSWTGSLESPSPRIEVEPTQALDVSEVLDDLAPTGVPAADLTSLQLELRPIGVCWVSAIADGRQAVYRLMQPGERVLVEARTEIVLRVGDPSSFAYRLNGLPGHPLGRAGVAMTVRITEANHLTFVTDVAPRSYWRGHAGAAQRAAVQEEMGTLEHRPTIAG